MNGQGRVVWRWVWCWLSVLVAGCGPHGSLTTTPPLPLATLPGYTHVPPTWTPTLRVRRTLTPNGSPSATLITTIVATGGLPVPLTLDAPTCAETPIGSLWCIGIIRNPLAMTAVGVIVRVSLVSADGTAFVQQEVLSARPLIRPGEWSPYGVLFTAPPAGIAGPVAELLNAETLPTDSSVMLTVDQVSNTPAHTGNPTYQIHATINNRSNISVHAVIVATLLDSAEHVTGFRQIEPEIVLAPNVTLPLDLSITPLIAGTTHSAIAADGLPVTN